MIIGVDIHSAPKPMQIQIEAFDLPGHSCAAAPGFPGYTGIHVAAAGRPTVTTDGQAGRFGPGHARCAIIAPTQRSSTRTCSSPSEPAG